jgi:hypothetical protein
MQSDQIIHNQREETDSEYEITLKEVSSLVAEFVCLCETTELSEQVASLYRQKKSENEVLEMHFQPAFERFRALPQFERLVSDSVTVLDCNNEACYQFIKSQLEKHAFDVLKVYYGSLFKSLWRNAQKKRR